jgi:predicted O-methyltransferase YrrM
MVASRPENAERDHARTRVIEAQKALIQSMRTYRKIAGRQPLFLLDPDIPPLHQQHLENCKALKGRGELLGRLPKGGRVLVVGTGRGNFAAQILDVLQPAELVTVDRDYDRLDREKLSAHPLFDRLRQVTGAPLDALATMPDSVFDVIYIDSDHRYPVMQKDLAAAHAKLRPGGVLMANDYVSFSPLNGRKCGVEKAINEFVNANGYDVQYLVLGVGGNHSVAIRKPE